MNRIIMMQVNMKGKEKTARRDYECPLSESLVLGLNAVQGFRQSNNLQLDPLFR